MKKYKSMNNWVSKKVVDNLIRENYRAVFYLLCNCGNLLESDIFNKTLYIIYGWFDRDLERMETTAKDVCGHDVYIFMNNIIIWIRERVENNGKDN